METGTTLCGSCKNKHICKFSDQCQEFWKSDEVVAVIGVVHDNYLPIDLSFKCTYYEEEVPTIKNPYFYNIKTVRTPCDQDFDPPIVPTCDNLTSLG